MGAKRHQVARAGVERNQTVVDAPFCERPEELVGKEPVRVARKGDNLDLLSLFVVNESVRRACLIGRCQCFSLPNRKLDVDLRWVVRDWVDAVDDEAHFRVDHSLDQDGHLCSVRCYLVLFS